MSVTVTAPAKVNLALGVGPARRDGYHPLATVYQAVGLHDEVTVRASGDRSSSISVVGDGVDASGVPAGSSNLALRAASLLAARHGVEEGVRVTVRKRIPTAGGLAGGSADAAAALVACDALWQTRTPREELQAIAAELGSDVPFCLVGGTAVGTGRGEVVTAAMSRGAYWWVLALSGKGLSTPAVYTEFDLMHAAVPVTDPEIPAPMMAALREGDAAALGAALTNDLQPAAVRLRPELGRLLELGPSSGAHGALLSGSGPTCLFLADGEEHAGELAERVQREAAAAGLAVDAVVTARGPVPGAHVIR